MIINCAKCNIKVAEIVTGSKIKKKAIMLCEKCETQRKALEMRFQGRFKPFDPYSNDIFDLFKGGFKK